ncbi:MAG: MFS transporter, partial [Limosilactobacillus vaginalis]|uniref:MFS transporter n=1 Tax=Limosilactobacillus vaginalis TaxID=1633 RepID=UPI0039967E88
TFLVKERHFKPIKKEKMRPIKEVMAEIPNRKLIFVTFLTTLIVMASSMSISLIISLYVRQLMHNHGNIAFVAGIVAATPGLGTLIAASKVGHTMDEIGPEKVLRIGLITAFILFVPMTFTHSPWSLAFWRFLLGLANAALMPAAQTVLTLNVPTDAFGRVFSINQSFQAGGAVFGSLLGSIISGLSSYPMVFAITGLTLLINFILIVLLQPKKPATN